MYKATLDRIEPKIVELYVKHGGSSRRTDGLEFVEVRFNITYKSKIFVLSFAIHTYQIEANSKFCLFLIREIIITVLAVSFK